MPFGRSQIMAIVGMATIWTAVHNQLMYPVTFTYVKEGGPTAVALYLAFAVLELAACAGVFATRRHIEQALFSKPARIAAIGCLGALGSALVVGCDFSSTWSSLGVAVGLALFSLYTPVYFVFWATRLEGLGNGTHAGGHTVALAAVASYALFCLFTAARLMLGVHASLVGPLYPLIGAALATFTAHRTPSRELPTGSFSLHQLPLNITAASLAFVYLCSLIITLLNPTASLSEYPPRREVLYLLDAALFAAVALIYLRHPNALRRCSMQAFAVLSIYLVGAVLLTALGAVQALGVGNFAAIAGKNAFDLFILLLLLVGMHTHHVRPVGPIAAYFAIVLLVPHLVSVLLTYHGSLAQLAGADAFPVVALIVTAAFLMSTTANVVLIFFVARMPKEAPDEGRQSHGVPAAICEQAQAAWGLSAREGDIMRMACTSASTAKIASTLCIAESTVYTHLKRIYRKAGVHSRQELVDLVETFGK